MVLGRRVQLLVVDADSPLHRKACLNFLTLLIRRHHYSGFVRNNVHQTHPLAIRYGEIISAFSHLWISSFTVPTPSGWVISEPPWRVLTHPLGRCDECTMKGPTLLVPSRSIWLLLHSSLILPVIFPPALYPVWMNNHKLCFLLIKEGIFECWWESLELQGRLVHW